jgi:hypothetical protein
MDAAPNQPTGIPTPDAGAVPSPVATPTPEGLTVPPPPPTAEAAQIPTVQPTPAEGLPSTAPAYTPDASISDASVNTATSSESTASPEASEQPDALVKAFEVIFEPMTITEMTTFVNDYMTRTRANGGPKAEEDLERVANAYAETIKKKMGITDPTPVH